MNPDPNVIFKALKSEEMANKVWAVQHLSQEIDDEDDDINNIRFYTRKCFKYLDKYYKRKTTPFNDIVFGAIYRECKNHILSDESRYEYVYSFISEQISMKNLMWIKLLKYFARSINQEDLQQNLLDIASENIQGLQKVTTEIGAAILKGLIQNGYTLPKQIFDILLHKNYALRIILKHLMIFFEKVNDDGNLPIMIELCKSFQPSYELVGAVLSLQNPPKEILDIVVNYVKCEPRTPRVILSLVKKWKSCERLHIFSINQLVDQVINAQLFFHVNAPILSQFFLDILAFNKHILNSEILDETENDNQHKKIEAVDLIKFFREFAINNIEETFTLIEPTLSAVPETEDVIISFMCKDESIAFFDLWCKIFEKIIPMILSDEGRSLMIRFISKTLYKELAFGHKITRDGKTEFCQNITINKSTTNFFDDFVSPQQLETRFKDELPTIFGWKHTSKMLLILPIDVDFIIKVCIKAAQIHGNALVNTFIEIMTKIDDKRLLDFLNRLSQNNSTMQIIMVKVAYAVIENQSHENIFNNIVQILTLIGLESATASIVRCAIIRRFNVLIDNSPTKDSRASVLSSFNSFNKFAGTQEFSDALKSSGLVIKPKSIHSMGSLPKLNKVESSSDTPLFSSNMSSIIKQNSLDGKDSFNPFGSMRRKASRKITKPQLRKSFDSNLCDMYFP